MVPGGVRKPGKQVTGPACRACSRCSLGHRNMYFELRNLGEVMLEKTVDVCTYTSKVPDRNSWLDGWGSRAAKATCSPPGHPGWAAAGSSELPLPIPVQRPSLCGLRGTCACFATSTPTMPSPDVYLGCSLLHTHISPPFWLCRYVCEACDLDAAVRLGSRAVQAKRCVLRAER